MRTTVFKSDEMDRIIFHFNKAHLTDSNIPMWTLKHKGNSYYVNHVDVNPNIGFSTKETPENEHTKGSIRFRGNLEIYKENNNLIGLIF
jgi:hypothetical protein